MLFCALCSVVCAELSKFNVEMYNLVIDVFPAEFHE